MTSSSSSRNTPPPPARFLKTNHCWPGVHIERFCFDKDPSWALSRPERLEEVYPIEEVDLLEEEDTRNYPSRTTFSAAEIKERYYADLLPDYAFQDGIFNVVNKHARNVCFHVTFQLPGARGQADEKGEKIFRRCSSGGTSRSTDVLVSKDVDDDEIFFGEKQQDKNYFPINWPAVLRPPKRRTEKSSFGGESHKNLHLLDGGYVLLESCPAQVEEEDDALLAGEGENDKENENHTGVEKEREHDRPDIDHVEGKPEHMIMTSTKKIKASTVITLVLYLPPFSICEVCAFPGFIPNTPAGRYENLLEAFAETGKVPFGAKVVGSPASVPEEEEEEVESDEDEFSPPPYTLAPDVQIETNISFQKQIDKSQYNTTPKRVLTDCRFDFPVFPLRRRGSSSPEDLHCHSDSLQAVELQEGNVVDRRSSNSTPAQAKEVERFPCSQGFGGTLTHGQDPSTFYAVDFDAEVGTEVVSLVNGTIVEVRGGNEKFCGPHVRNLWKWNEIAIQFDGGATGNDSKNYSFGCVDEQTSRRSCSAGPGKNANPTCSKTTSVELSPAPSSPKFLSNKQYRIEYVHLDKIFVKVGDKVSIGQKIGTSGQAGFTPTPHLHLQVNEVLPVVEDETTVDGPSGIHNSEIKDEPTAASIGRSVPFAICGETNFCPGFRYPGAKPDPAYCDDDKQEVAGKNEEKQKVKEPKISPTVSSSRKKKKGRKGGA
ncbi:unnamed protein product [Amoebophrya sp. A120]|nr:unnamed protein product [Amoebophrya sp. A120]|eukprot:GSA120T00007375001.1